MWLFYFINTFSFENEICCPNSFRIRQDIDTIAMLYSLACRIDQIVEIITLFANSAFSNGSNSNILSSIMVGFILSAKVVIKLVIIVVKHLGILALVGDEFQSAASREVINIIIRLHLCLEDHSR